MRQQVLWGLALKDTNGTFLHETLFKTKVLAEKFKDSYEPQGGDKVVGLAKISITKD